jgi:hypothetical protein
MRHTGNRIVGSNPTLSASFSARTLPTFHDCARLAAHHMGKSLDTFRAVMSDPYQVRFVRIPRWALVLAGLAAAAFAIALFLLSITVFLVMLPVIAIASGLYYLFGGKRMATRRGPDNPEIIEGEYRVVEPERIDRDRSPRS